MTAATNRRNRRAQARSRRRAGANWSARAADRRRADTTTFTYSDPMFLTAADGPSGRLATYVYDSESKRRRIYEGAAFTTIVWDGWDYLQWRRPSGTHVFHTMNGEIVGESVGGVVRDYLLDPLGSVVATLDSGGLVDQFEYWPYGELVDDLPAGAPVFLWVGGLGYWFDTDERRYVRHRTLRNDLGSWMQLDPLWPKSVVAFSSRNPMLPDPFGLWPVPTPGLACLSCDKFPGGPCAWAKHMLGLGWEQEQYLGELSYLGKVICCKGQKHICAWSNSGSNGVVDCIYEHEAVHAGDFVCAEDGELRAPDVRSRFVSECLAHTRQLICLLRSCPSDNLPEHCWESFCSACSFGAFYCSNVGMDFVLASECKRRCKGF